LSRFYWLESEPIDLAAKYFKYAGKSVSVGDKHDHPIPTATETPLILYSNSRHFRA